MSDTNLRSGLPGELEDSCNCEEATETVAATILEYESEVGEIGKLWKLHALHMYTS